MKKLNRVAIAIAAAALATVAGAQEIHNWKSNSGEVWKNNSWASAGVITAGPQRLQPVVVMALSLLLLQRLLLLQLQWLLLLQLLLPLQLRSQLPLPLLPAR
jgi:Flp pilus assembly protein CpaB